MVLLTNHTIKTISTIAVVASLLYLTVLVLSPFAGIIITASIIAVILNPLYLYLVSKTNKPSLSSALSLLLLVIFIVVPLVFLIRSIAFEIIALAQTIENYPDIIATTQTKVDLYIRSWGIPSQIESLNLKSTFSQSLSFLAKNSAEILVRSGNFILDLFFTVITIYFLLINQSNLNKYIANLALLPPKVITVLKQRSIEMINGTVVGYMLVILLQTLVGVLGFLVFTVDSPLLLGTVYGIASLLPVVGGLLIWIPIAIWFLANGTTVTAILITAWFIISSLLIENLIAPKVIGKSTKLHQLLVLFSVFGGISRFGLLGMVLGPTIVALGIVALDIVREMSLNNTYKATK